MLFCRSFKSSEEGGLAFMAKKNTDQPQYSTLAEVMRGANLEEVGITYRPQPDSAKLELLASCRKSQSEENLPEGAEEYAQMMRARYRHRQ